METIRRIIGAARGGLLRHIQPGRLLRAAMPEVFPVTAAAALLAAYGMPAGMGSLFGAGGSYALPVLGIAFLCAIWCAGMNIYPAFAGTVLGSLAGGRPQGAAAAMLILLCTFLQKKKKRLPEGMRYLYTAAVLTVLYPVFGTLTIQGAAGYFGGICVSVASAVLMRHALGGIESILGRREVTDERIVTIALLAGVAVMAFGKFELFGISPGAVAAAVFCMLAAYSKGIAAVSCAAAAAVGRVMGCGGDLVFVAVLCSCTLLCCCLRVFGKWGIGGGFTAASIVFAVLIPGAGKLNIAETLIAAAAFLAVPDDFFEKLDANRPGYRDGKYEQRLSTVTYKLNSLADVLGQMAKLFEPNGSGEQAAADGFVNRQLAGVANCIKKLALDGVYGRGQKYRISFGCAVSPKAGNSETGDSCCVREFDGLRMAAISDGMGSGGPARRESLRTVELFAALTGVGFRPEEAAECLNRLLLREGEDMYATLDALVFDTVSGSVSLAKHGAPPSYILREGRLSTLYAEALPVGILPQARPAVCTARLRKGDIVVMMSDGVADALGKELVAAVTDRTRNAGSPKAAAEELLAFADEKGGRMDDMTVIVAKVE